MGKHRLKTLKLAWLLLLTLAACDRAEEDLPEVDLDIVRLEKLIFSMDSTAPTKAVNAFAAEHPVAARCFFGLQPDESGKFADDTAALMLFQAYQRNPPMQAAYDSVMLAYPEIEDIQDELAAGFARIKAAFADAQLPEIYTFMTEYELIDPMSRGCGVCDNLLVICLDLYLGADFSFYPMTPVPDLPMYVLPKLVRDQISSDAMRALAHYWFGAHDRSQTLVDQMVHLGKLTWFVSSVLPKVEPHHWLGYTEDQFEWSEAAEEEVWAYFLGEDILFKPVTPGVIRLISEGPTSGAGFPPQAPGNLGMYAGWKIVQAYAKRSGKSLEQVMNTPSREIFENSKYKP